MSFASCGFVTAKTDDLQSQIDAANAKLVDATTTVKGIVQLADDATAKAATDTTKALTAGSLAAALNDASGPNAAQKAVTNAVEIALATDAGAQAAIANAIKDDLAADSGFVDAVAAGLGFVDCTGAAIASGESLATCSDLSAALASGSAPSGAAGGGLTGTYPNPGLSAAAVVNAVESGIAADTGAQAAIATAIADDLAGNTSFVSSMSSNLGATAAETIAGTEAAKFISPDDLKATLQTGAAYPIAVFAKTGGDYALAGGNSNNTPGQTIVGYRSGLTSGAVQYFGSLGYDDGTKAAAVFGSSNGVAAVWAGYFQGNVFYSGSLTSSDKRLKDNIKPAVGLDLPIYSYDKFYVTEDKDGKDVRNPLGNMSGVIAQEVQKKRPDLVEEHDGYLSIKESSVLFELIANLQARIAKLEAK